jgi:hypothetical protein
MGGRICYFGQIGWVVICCKMGCRMPLSMGSRLSYMTLIKDEIKSKGKIKSKKAAW